MAVRTISTKLAVEGEAEYKQKIASCNSELKTLKSSLALVQSEYKNNANSMEALTAKGEALSAMQTAQAKKVAELEKALENCQKAQTAYADRVAAAEANVSKYEQALAELKDSTGDTSEEQAALTAELEKWKEELANAEAGQNAAERGVENWQQQLNKAKIELNETNEAISENDKYLDEAKKSTDGCATSIDKFGNKVKDSKDGITQLAAALAAAGVAKSVKEIADALMECSQAAAGFETALAKVSTLADTSVVSMDTIKAQLVSLSGETGVAVESLAEATYQALSAGVDTANVVDFVSTATKLSVAGFTESATAVDVVTTALNAYGLAGSDAEKVASMLVKTQDLGKTSVGELAATMGRVIPTAAAYNVSLDQLSASYAIITASGTNTAIATTNLGAMFNELASEGGTVATILEEQTGKSFAELMADGASLGDVISILSDSVDGNSTAFSNLWSSTTAGQAALTLLNQGSEKFNDTLVKMQNSSGAVERNFETMADTTEFAQQRMTTASENLKIAIGDQLNPALEKLYSVGADAFTWATDFVNENPWLVKAITATTVGIGTLAAGVTLAANAASIAAVAQGVLNAVMAANPAFLVAAGVTALVAAIGTFILTLDNADEETRAFTESLQETKSAYEELSDSMAEEQATTAATVDSLQSLLEVEEKSAAQKAAIAEMVAQLNEDVPNLGLAYDAATDSINMTTEALDALVERAADQEEYEAQVARLSELYTEQAEIWPDQYVHHMIVQVLAPVLMRGMDFYCCGSIPGRGPHRARKAIEKWLEKDQKGTKYAAELDIKKFYPSLSPREVMRFLRRKIKDEAFLGLIWRIIKDGIKIGFYISQWLANAVLEPLDHYIREKLGDGVRHYVRYIDNLTIFGHNKKKLHRAIRSIMEFLGRMGLRLKENWQLYNTRKRMVNAVGYRYKRGLTLIRKKNLLRLKRQCTRARKRIAAHRKIAPIQARGILSRSGQLKHCAGWSLYDKHVRPIEKTIKSVVREASRKERILCSST